MRVLGHNGEINTLLGNVNWMKARESAKGTPIASEFDIEEEGDTSSFDPSCDIRDLVDSANTEQIVQECNTQDSPDTLEVSPVTSLTISQVRSSAFSLIFASLVTAPCRPEQERQR